jgi:hypothetical protein
MEKDEIRNTILDVIIEVVEAQAKAIRRLRGTLEKDTVEQKSMSKIEMVHDILLKARKPLHIADIIEQVSQIHGIRLDRESIVSAISKKVSKEDRFIRTDRNTFAVKEGKR